MEQEQLMREASQLQEMLVANRRYLHAHAETGFHLTETLAFVKKSLKEMGYEPIEYGKAGIAAIAGGKKDGGVFLLRADMDALPIHEESKVDFSCETGNMHACGHDMHTSMLLGAAKLLKEHEDEIEGTVKLMFQPAEEIFEGAHDMIEAGVLKNPDISAALMIHVMAGMPFDTGTVIVPPPGVSASAADFFEINVQGTGCHGSMPHTGADPLHAAAHILIALEEINARELAMDDQAVLTIGSIHAGTAKNVIPDTAVMGGSIRTFDEKTRAFIKERMTQITEGIAKCFRVKAEVSFGNGCPTLVNDSDLAACIPKYAKELLGEQRAFSAEQLKSAAFKAAGSEDFAYVSQEVPAVMVALAAGRLDKGYTYPQHHPKVRFDEDALMTGCAVYAYTAMRWLEEHK